MMRFASSFTLLLAMAVPGLTHAQGEWGSLKGTVVVKGRAPKMAQIMPDKDVMTCNKDGAFFDETWVVNPKNNGLANVVVWIEPADAKRGAPFPTALINPALAKPAQPSISIDQPCCKFIPHISVAREGQDVIIKNSAPIPHNAKWISKNNGDINPLIPSGGSFAVKNVKAEKFPVALGCSIHPWMNAKVFVFDHPYWAVTDADGKFDIKDVPAGNFKVYYLHDSGYKGGRAGAAGEVTNLKAEVNDLKIVDFPVPAPAKP